MSKLLDYLKLVPRGIKNPKAVLEGWINDAKLENDLLTEEEMGVILYRRSICEGCPFNSVNAKTSQEYFNYFKKGYDTGSRTDLHCSICSCPINKKTAALSTNCGIKDSVETMNENLKWTKHEGSKQ